jgi:hypothetical protein
MGIRGDQLADQLDEANREMLAVIEAIPDERWKSICDADGRQCNAVANHVAGANRAIADWVQTLANGEAIPVTMEMVHANNANRAAEDANVTRDDVAARLRENADYASRMLRAMSDDQLAQSAPLGLAGGKEMSAGDLAERILIGHVIGHMNDLKPATTGA